MKLERYNKDAYVIMKDNKVIGCALRCSNDKWSAVDENDNKLTKQQFLKPKNVRDWFVSNDHR